MGIFRYTYILATYTLKMEELFMKLLKTQQIKNAYQRYLNSDYWTLWHAYTGPSYNKERAWKYCEDLENKYSGFGLRVIGYNSSTFSAGFIGVVDGVDVFVYITHANDYYIPLADL